MIQEHFRCNICHIEVAHHPSAGADCLSLKRAGPVGLENSVLVEDDSWSAAKYTEIHICRRCERALTEFFKEMKVKP